MRADGVKVRCLVAISLLLILQGCLLRREKPSIPETLFVVCIEPHNAKSHWLQTAGKESKNHYFNSRGRAEVLIPAMEGDMMEVLGVKYINNDPNDYELLRLVSEGRVIRRYSYSELSGIPSQPDGCRMLDP
ncbi:MAG: hypothetical protein J5J00_06280 [Deltaproteobacteria bacterium]|nr:hypothetical protein [Deltaproteobacteria bacterium]